ncbi:MAG TPA: phospholipase A2 [Phytomonospora sp.]
MTTKLRIAAVLAATAASVLIPAAAQGDDVRARADAYMNMRAGDFAGVHHDAPFEWSNDGCSGPTEKIFHDACVQHDFGYRNYGAHYALKLSVTRETKDWIDARFHEEMDRACVDTYPAGEAVASCMDNATLAWTAVHLYGDAHFF